MRAVKYDGINDGMLVFDGNGIAKVGDVGALQTLATREDSPNSCGIAYYDSTNFRSNTINCLGDGQIITGNSNGRPNITDLSDDFSLQTDNEQKTLNIATGAITTIKIADCNITTIKIADGNITTDKIADGNITTIKIANEAITTDKIAANTITMNNINEILKQFLSPVGSITMFAGDIAPQGWYICDGSQKLITDNKALFAVIGNIYGGNGTYTFNLPNLQGRVPMGYSANGTVSGKPGGESITGSNVLGNINGKVMHTLTVNEMPEHTHSINNLTIGVGGVHDHDAHLTIERSGQHSHYLEATNAINGTFDMRVKMVPHDGGVSTSVRPTTILNDDPTYGLCSRHTHTGTVGINNSSSHTHTLSGSIGINGNDTPFNILAISFLHLVIWISFS
jgi:microcystin-dependent protein